ncbi:reverse transcriptase domain-containing protein, partial [Tanacetum coccineum]
EMALKFLSKYFPPSMVMKLRNDISNFRQLPDELLFEAWERYKLLIDQCPNHNMLPATQIDTFYNGLTLRHRDTINAAVGGTFMKRRPEECYDLIENMTAHHNDWDTSSHRGESSSSTTSTSSKIAALAQQMIEIRKDMIQMYRLNQQVNSVTPSCETCGGPHSYYECQVAGGYTQDVYATTGNYNSGALPRNTIPNLRKQINSITTRSGLTTAEPFIPPPVPPTPREEVEQELKTLMDEVHITSPTSTAHVPLPGIQPVVKDLLKDKEKLEELANTPINDECSAILLNKVPEKLGDPRKFLIPCILQDLKVCNSLADSRASINLMPLSIYEKLGIGSLKPTRMTLELANRSVPLLKGIAQDVIVKVDKFNFLADFVVVDFEADLRVPIILRRPFLRTAKALVDLYEEKLTLRVENEQVVFYTDKSSRNNSRDIQSVHCINIIDFSKDKPISDSTTFSSDSLPGSSFPSSPLVETSDSLLEEFADELALLDSFLPGNKDDNFNLEADLREIESLLNRDPSTDSSHTTDINIIDPILERFTDEPALVYSSPLGDDDDDLFDLKYDNDEWKKLDSTLPKESSESSEIATLISSPFGNEDNVFNPGILILGGTQIFHDESKDKDLKVNSLTEVLLIFVENNFLSHSSDRSTDRELLFFLELTVIETLLSFSSKNEDKVFNPGILFFNRVHSINLDLSYQSGTFMTKEFEESQARDSHKNKRFLGGNPCYLSSSSINIIDSL